MSKSLPEGPILVLDDHADEREMLLHIFEQAGIECYIAATPQEAITTYLDKRPKLALLDIAISTDMTGFDVARIIWTMDAKHETCMVLWSCYAQHDVEDQLTALVSGGDGLIDKENVLQKPIVPERLLGELARIQSGRRNTTGPVLMDKIKAAAEKVKTDNPTSSGSSTSPVILAIILFGMVAYMCFQFYWMGQLKAENQAIGRRLEEVKTELKDQQDKDRTASSNAANLNAVFIQQLREQFAEFKGQSSNRSK